MIGREPAGPGSAPPGPGSPGPVTTGHASGFDDLHRRSRQDWSVDDPAAHGRAVRGMFARIAGVYDTMNHLLSLNLDRRWRRDLISRLDGDSWEILDLCAGTGDLALGCLAAGKGRQVVAADFCPEMLAALGRKRTDPRSPDAALHLLVADALSLPLPRWSLDAVIVGFGVRNFADVRRGLAEITRVLRPAGQLMVLDFFREDPAATGPFRGPPPAVRWGLNRLVPLLGRVVGGDGAAYSYLPGSMGEFLTPAEFAGLLTEAGYKDVFAARQTLGIAHIVGGRSPS